MWPLLLATQRRPPQNPSRHPLRNRRRALASGVPLRPGPFPLGEARVEVPVGSQADGSSRARGPPPTARSELRRRRGSFAPRPGPRSRRGDSAAARWPPSPERRAAARRQRATPPFAHAWGPGSAWRPRAEEASLSVSPALTGPRRSSEPRSGRPPFAPPWRDDRGRRHTLASSTKRRAPLRWRRR